MKIQKGLWSETTFLIMGAKANEERFNKLKKQIIEARKDNGGFDEDSEVFWLHHDIDGLEGYYTGDYDNPDAIYIGFHLWYNNEEALVYKNGDKLDLEKINSAVNDFWKTNEEFFDYAENIKTFLGEDVEIELHFVTEKYFLSKEEIEERCNDKIYPKEEIEKYKGYLEADNWSYREVWN